MKRFTTSQFILIGATVLLSILQGCSDDQSKGILGNDSNQSVSERRQNESNVNANTKSANIELYGRVATVDAGAREITMVGVSTLISVLEGAEVVFKNGGSETPILLGDIMPGDSIEARGNMTSGVVLAADRIRIRPDDAPENEVEFSGRVESIDPTSRVMFLVGDSRRIDIHPNAEVVAKNSGNESPIELSAITIGDSVDVRGASQTDGSVMADRVRVRLGGDDFHTEFEFTKTILSIDYAAGIIFVDSVPEAIIVDDNTFIYTNDDMRSGSSGSMSAGDEDDDDSASDTTKTIIALTDLSVGDTIEVHANRIDASSLYAVAIELEDGAFDNQLEVQFKDLLASVDPGTGEVTFVNDSRVGTVVSGAELLGLLNETLTLADFSAGELVEVRGFKTSESTFDIVRMHKDNN